MSESVSRSVVEVHPEEELPMTTTTIPIQNENNAKEKEKKENNDEKDNNNEQEQPLKEQKNDDSKPINRENNSSSTEVNREASPSTYQQVLSVWHNAHGSLKQYFIDETRLDDVRMIEVSMEIIEPSKHTVVFLAPLRRGDLLPHVIASGCMPVRALGETAHFRVLVAFLSVVIVCLACSASFLYGVSSTWDPSASGLAGDTDVQMVQMVWAISPCAGALAQYLMAQGDQEFRFVRWNPRLLFGDKPIANLLKKSVNREIVVTFLAFIVPCIISLVQYIIFAASGVTGWLGGFADQWVGYFNLDDTSFSDRQSAAAGGVIYSFFFGIFWDLTPPIDDDMGNGGGFSGVSWVLLSILEEVGWSLILFPALIFAFRGRIVYASIVTGFIWSFWHYPFILASGAYPEGVQYHPGLGNTPLPYACIMFTVTIVSLRIFICRLLVESRCIWTGVIAHSSHNLFLLSVFGALADVSGTNNGIPYSVGESGAIAAPLYMVVAIVIVYMTWRMTNFDETKVTVVSVGDSASNQSPEAIAAVREATVAEASKRTRNRRRALVLIVLAIVTLGLIIAFIPWKQGFIPKNKLVFNATYVPSQLSSSCMRYYQLASTSQVYISSYKSSLAPSPCFLSSSLLSSCGSASVCSCSSFSSSQSSSVIAGLVKSCSRPNINTAATITVATASLTVTLSSPPSSSVSGPSTLIAYNTSLLCVPSVCTVSDYSHIAQWLLGQETSTSTLLTGVTNANLRATYPLLQNKTIARIAMQINVAANTFPFNISIH